MSITNSELKIVCDELNSVLTGGRLLGVLHFHRKRILLSVRRKGYTYSVLVCIEQPFLRIHLTRDRLRGKKNAFRFGQLLEKNLAGFKLEEVRQLNEDRVAELRLSGKGVTRFVLVELFRAKPNLYLLDEKRRVIADWRGETAGQEYAPKPKAAFRETPPRFAAISGEMFSYSLDREYEALEERAAFETEKESARSSVRKELKKTRRLLDNLRGDAEKAAGWEELNRKAELLKANLASIAEHETRARVVDWATDAEVRIPLDASLTVKQNMERMFERSKKLKRGLSQIHERIRRCEEKLSRLEAAAERVKGVNDHESLRALLGEIKDLVPTTPKDGQKHKQVRSGPFRVFTSREGLKIFVGRNDAENDRLTFSFARGRDLWFHARDFPGSHVVVRADGRHEVGREAILDGATLALYYSNGRTEEVGDVMYTERKYVAKPKDGPPGTVNVARQRVLRVKLDQERIRSLKRTMPGASEQEQDG